MGTNKTEHYGLHQWVPEDDFLRTDFNENFEKLDTALHAAEQNLRADLTGDVQRLDTALDTLERELRADHDADITQVESALSAAQQTLRKEFNGNLDKTNAALESVRTLAAGKSTVVFGSYVGDGEMRRSIDLGFTIKWIFIYPAGSPQPYGKAAMAAPGFPPPVDPKYAPLLTVTGTAFQVGFQASYTPFTNSLNDTFYYIAAK